jgi:CHAD domain-containing protein
MSFRFQPDDPDLASALRRIAGAELQAALTAAGAGTLPPEAVHGIRKHMKKLRGLLRLVQRDFPDFALENAALRDVGRVLSLRRDADVRVATFDRLFPVCPPALALLRQDLLARRDAITPGPGQAGTEAALRALLTRSAGWTLRGSDRSILRRGLARTRRKAAVAMVRAARSPEAEAIHDWRKRAKDFWYQARLLAPVWPEVIGPQCDSASALTEDLGLHHDIAVLLADLSVLPPDAATLFRDQARAMQQQIEARVFPAGRRLFAGEPEAMADLWLDWWVLWRDQAASAPDSARSISATVSSTP